MENKSQSCPVPYQILSEKAVEFMQINLRTEDCMEAPPATSRFQPIDAGGLKSRLHDVLRPFAKCKFANYVAHLHYFNSTVTMMEPSASDGLKLEPLIARCAGQRARQAFLLAFVPSPSYGNTKSHIENSCLLRHHTSTVPRSTPRTLNARASRNCLL